MTGIEKKGISRVAKRLLTVSVVAATAFSAYTENATAAGCTKVASLSGSDSAAGTEVAPYRSVQKLVDSLSAGETGCVRAGSYAGNVKVSRSGAPGAHLTLTSYPGERAVLVGKLWVADSANFVTISSLNLDGRNSSGLPSPAINGDDVTFADNDVTNHHTGICFNVGPVGYGRANRTVLERNRIHDCGELPATNLDHGVYIEQSTGARIVENTIFDNADRGVQLYPDADDTHIARNVIDGNGEGVLIGGGDEGSGAQASSNNLIEQNVITNSTQRYNVESYWPGLVGEGNVVRQNCIFGGAKDGDNHGLAPPHGFSAQSNTMAEPRFVDRAAKDFRLRPDSPCLGAPPSPPPPVILFVELQSRTGSLRPGARLRLIGKVVDQSGGRYRKVVLKLRRGKRWRRVTRVRSRGDGRFSTKPRLRRSGRSARKGTRKRRRLALRRVRLSGRTRILRLRAVVPGVGRSQTVKVRVRRR